MSSHMKADGTIQVTSELKAFIAGLSSKKRVAAAGILAKKTKVPQAVRMAYLTACGLTMNEILSAMDIASGGALVRSAMGLSR